MTAYLYEVGEASFANLAGPRVTAFGRSLLLLLLLLALFNLAASEPFDPVPFEQCFIVESVLELLIPFARATMITVGWNATSSTVLRQMESRPLRPR